MTLLGRVDSLQEVGGSYRMHGANSYEPQSPQLDLAQLRKSIAFSRSTSRELLRLAAELELPRPERILSIADLANRLISLRLGPEQHPIAEDTRARLVLDFFPAARRRSNVSVPMKLMFAGWFVAISVAPRRLARWLAELFLFPARRGSLNRALGRLHRPGRRSTATA